MLAIWQLRLLAHYQNMMVPNEISDLWPVQHFCGIYICPVRVGHHDCDIGPVQAKMRKVQLRPWALNKCPQAEGHSKIEYSCISKGFNLTPIILNFLALFT